MRPSRIVALAAIVPLAIAAVALVAHEPVGRWLASEPVLVAQGSAGAPQQVEGASLTVVDARVVDPGSEEAGFADAPEGSQVVVVDVVLESEHDVQSMCRLSLGATVAGDAGRWAHDYGVSEVTSCYAEEDRLEGVVGFVVPPGPISDARLLVGGGVVWRAVPLDL